MGEGILEDLAKITICIRTPKEQKTIISMLPLKGRKFFVVLSTHDLQVGYTLNPKTVWGSGKGKCNPLTTLPLNPEP